MRRVSVVGAPGSGKSTLAARLATHVGAPHVELDEIFHQADWTPLPAPEFLERVEAATSGDTWVVDGNYSAVRPTVWGRADTVVWIDLPRRLVIRRVTRRTLRRVVTRQRLWNGNREPFTNLYHRDPMRNIIRYSWVKHPDYVTRYAAAIDDPAHAHLRFVRLRTVDQVDAFAR